MLIFLISVAISQSNSYPIVLIRLGISTSILSLLRKMSKMDILTKLGPLVHY